FVTLFLAWGGWTTYRSGGLYGALLAQWPYLLILSLAGMAMFLALGLVGWLDTRIAGVCGIALVLGIVSEVVSDYVWSMSRDPTFQFALQDLRPEFTDYWTPFWMTISASILFALLYDKVSKPLTVFIALTLLIYPWRTSPETVIYDGQQHSIGEHWGFNLFDGV